MEAIEERPVQRNEPFVRIAKPLQACFKAEQEVQHEWQDYDAEIMPGFLIDNVRRAKALSQYAQDKSKSPVVEPLVTPYKLSQQALEESAAFARRVRTAQACGKHQTAIKLTTLALRLIRNQPKPKRRALNSRTQELLNLRSVSLIAVGECGEAWRCITLMAKLWRK